MYNARRALVVGINTYRNASHLSTCITDARAMGELLAEHEDGRPNYDCRVLLDQTENGKPITMSVLREACTQLFADTKDDVLFYFSGHGALTPFGGQLCAFDSERSNWGVPMQEIMDLAYNSKSRDIVMILDCCHAGELGDPSLLNSAHGRDPLAVIRADMTVIAASLGSQSAFEGLEYSVFTGWVLEALRGGAGDHLGWVTAQSVYSYVERRFGWRDQQRPVYKSHTTGTRVIRECSPHIDRAKLRRLAELFPDQHYLYRLDPEYEPHDKNGELPANANLEKVAIAALFKDLRDVALLKPSIPGEQFYYTAVNGHTVELTPRGRVTRCSAWAIRSSITSHLNEIGLDPYQGFFHAVRYGHAALASDLTEEFRLWLLMPWS